MHDNKQCLRMSFSGNVKKRKTDDINDIDAGKDIPNSNQLNKQTTINKSQASDSTG